MNCDCKSDEIKITKGCSKTLTFNFDSDISGLKAEFCVKKDINSLPLLTKIIENLEGKEFTLELSPDDTDVFSFETNENVSQYIWGLDVFDDDVRTAVFPQTGKLPPIFLVFKHIVG